MSNQWRLATTQAGLEFGHVIYLGVPRPTVQFADFAQAQPQGDGGSKAVGYKSAVLTWQILSKSQLSTLSQLVKEARDGTGTIYATVTRTSGQEIMQWIDISGLVAPLTVQPFQNGLNPYGVQSATLTINNVTILNNPSAYA